MLHDPQAEQLARRFAALPDTPRRSEFLAQMRRLGLSPGRLPIPPRAGPAGRLPASAAQRQQWFLWQMDPQGDAYHIRGGLRFPEALDTTALAAALETLAARHEALRTTFAARGDGTVEQVVHAALPVELALFDDTPEGLEAWATAFSNAPFDLVSGPLWRVGRLAMPDGGQALLLVIHHIVADAQSMAVLVEEFAASYGAHAGGRAPALPVLTLQYADCSAWQQLWLDAGERERQLAAWTARLDGPGPVLQLPSDEPRGSAVAWRAAEAPIDLPEALCREVAALARSHRATPFMVLMAAFQLLLSRYTDLRDIRVGMPTAGRTRVETERVVGLFVNMQVVRVDVDPALSLGGLVDRVRDAVTFAQDHQDLPFDSLVDALAPQRGTEHPPLVQAVFNFLRPAPAAPGAFGGLAASPLPAGGRTAQFEIALNIEARDDGSLAGGLVHAEGLFSADTAARMARHYRRLLESLVRRPHDTVRDIVLPDAAEQDRLLTWGRGPAAATPAGLVHAALERHAQARPDAPAVVHGHRTLSHAELHRTANRLARRLVREGVGPDVRVGVLMERSVDLVATLLAVLKAGGAYVPLDPRYPAPRLKHMMADSGMRLLLTCPGLAAADTVPEGLRVLCPDTPDLAAEADSPPRVAAHPEQLAYVIYTSGSTGLPKGVAVAHGPLADHVRASVQLYDMGPDSRELHFLSFSFDGAHERWLTALASGGAIVLSDSVLWTPEQCGEALNRHRITNAGFPPAYLRTLADWAKGVDTPPPVDLYSFGGEAMPKATYDQARRTLRPRCFINGYGPTEAVVTPLVWKVDAGTTFDGAYAPIGRPVAGRQAHVLDANLAPVPQGVPGELYLGGTGLARGYLDRPGLTAERFVPDPFGPPGGRLYRTGDRVRWRPDAQLEYLGRIDQQIKVRGFRIEPGEIESRLLALPGVHQAVVQVRPGAAGTNQGVRLVACVATAPGAGLDGSALREALATELPGHMVPDAVIVLPALPITSNGKVDHLAFATLAPEPKADAGAPPEGEVETCLAAIWSEVLGVATVGRHANFFELGGDSILSLQIVTKARRAGWHLTPRHLFERQTLARLAAAATPLAAAAHDTASPTAGDVPLLPVQADFFAMAVPRRHHWNQAVLLATPSALDPGLVAHALSALVRHHDALRLRYRTSPSGGWTQHHAPAGEDTTGLLWQRRAGSPDEIEAVCEAAQRSLDLGAGPLLRAVAIDAGAAGWRLLLAVHHLAVDGVSWRILLEDLQTACRQLRSGAAVTLPPKTSSYQAWATRLAAHAASGALEAERAHWRALAGTPSALPPPAPDADTVHAPTHRRSADVLARFDTDTTRRLLRDAPAAYRTQVNDLLLTAFGRALCRWSGQARVLIDLEGHGREPLFPEIDHSRTVGWFTTVYPVRLEPTGPLEDAVPRVKEMLRGVPAHGIGYGLQRLAAASGEVVELPPRDVVFNYLGQFDGSFSPEADWRPALEPAGALHDADAPLGHPLSVNGQVFGGSLVLAFTHCTTRLSTVAVQSLADLFREELAAVVAHCIASPGGLTPSDVDLVALTPPDLQALVRGAGVPARDIEDVLPLTPLQQGMLVRAVREPRSVANVVQFEATFGALDLPRLCAAWQAAVDRHRVLRTAYLWGSGLPEPLQLVHRAVRLPFDLLDWRDRDDEDTAWTTLCEQAYTRGFDLGAAPLMRVTVARTGEDRHRLVWTWHHILLDGWSMSQLLGEVFTQYRGGSVAAPVLEHRDHLRWLRARDLRPDEARWRALRTSVAPTLLGKAAILPRHSASEHGLAGDTLDVPATRALQEAAARHQVTLNTLVQAAWALLLQRATGQRPVVFGVTLSGRSDELPGADRVMGLCINTLPILTAPSPADRVGDWLRNLQADNLDLRQREHVPLHRIQHWLGQPGRPLFDSVIVYENYPVDAAHLQAVDGGMPLLDASSRGVMGWPLTIVVVPGAALRVQMTFERSAFDETTVAALLSDLVRLLHRLGEGAASDTVGAVTAGLPDRPAPTASPEAPAAAPMGWTPTARRLAGVWRSVLGTPEATPDDDFFDQGGDSLAALRLAGAWDRLAGQRGWPGRLHVAEVFRRPRLRALADAIDAIDAAARVEEPA